MLEVLIYVIFGLLIGSTAGWWIQSFRLKSDLKYSPEQLSNLESELAALKERITIASTQLREKEKAFDLLQQERTQLQASLQEVNSAHAALEQKTLGLEQTLAQERQRIQELNTQLKSEFENMANEILNKTTKRFSETNHQRLGEILDPLKERIDGFRSKVEQGQKEQAQFKGELNKQFENMQQMSGQLAEEARQLSTALRGENKKAGDWGEMVLERILELSGLTKGREFETQYSDQNEDGDTIRPDVIVRYPGQEGALIIDSKVSLSAYTDFFNAEDDPTKQSAAQRHLISVKAHIDGIAAKKYETAQGLITPEFILVFLPVEGALTLALEQDPRLYDNAFRKNIILITPSTLLATLKLVKSLWRQDDQNKNAQKIAVEGAGLYDKFETFYRTLQDIEKHFQSANKGFIDAKKQLATGNGNLIGRVEKLKKLGVSAKKSLDPQLVQDALAENTSNPLDKGE